MDGIGCATLDQCESIFKKNLLVDDVEEICDHLMTLGFVDNDDNLQINSENNSLVQRVDLLLKHLKRKGDSFKAFEAALNATQHDHLVACLKKRYSAIQSPPVLNVPCGDNSKELSRWLSNGGVPPLERCHVARTTLAADVRKALHDLRNELEGCVLIHGAAGMGKTALAVEVLRNDSSIKDTFPGGVFWFSIGKDVNQDDGGKLLVKLQAMVTALCLDADVPKHAVSSVEEAQRVLRHLVCKKLFLTLLVLDDVWNPDVAAVFNIGARILVTSRQANVLTNLPVDVSSIEVRDGLTKEESDAVFRNWLKIKSQDALPKDANLIWRRVSGNPLAIGMIGALVQRRGEQKWAACVDKLKAGEDISSPRDKQQTLHDAIAISIDCIEDEWKRENYYRLAVFDDDVYLSTSVLSVLWQMDCTEDAYDLMEEFVDLSLATRVVAKKECTPCSGDYLSTYALHDLQLDVIKARRRDTLPQIHKLLLVSYQKKAKADWCNLPNDGYIHWFLAQHLKRANDTETLVKLYTDLRFIQSKLNITGPGDIVHDLHKYRAEFERCSRQHDWEHVRVFVQSHAHQLSSCQAAGTRCDSPDFLQLALCQPDDSPVYQQAVHLASQLSKQRVFWQWKNRAQAANQLVWSQLASTQAHVVVDGAADEVKSVDVLQDKLLVACANGALLLLDISNGQEVCSFPPPSPTNALQKSSATRQPSLNPGGKMNRSAQNSLVQSTFMFSLSGKDENNRPVNSKNSKLLPAIHDDVTVLGIVKAAFTSDGEGFICCSQITQDDEEEVGLVSYYKMPAFAKSQVGAVASNESSPVPGRVVDHCWHPLMRVHALPVVPCRREDKQQTSTLCDAALLCSKETSSPVTCCATKNDKFLFGYKNGDIDQYSILNGKLYRSVDFPKHDGSVEDLHISECGNMFVSAACGSHRTLISVYSFDTICWSDYHGHKNAKPTAVRFLPQCSNCVICSAADNEIHAWQREDRQLLKKFRVSGDVLILCMDFSSDGKMLAVGKSDHGIRIWNFETQETITNFIGHTGFVHAIRFSSSSPLKLVSGASDNTLMVWDVPNDESSQTTSFECDFALDTFVDGNDEEHVVLIVQDHKRKVKLIFDEEVVRTTQHALNCTAVCFAVNCFDQRAVVGFENGALLELMLSEDFKCVKQERWLIENITSEDGQALRCVHYQRGADGWLLACGDAGSVDVFNRDGKHVQRLTSSKKTCRCVKALFFRVKSDTALAAVWEDGTLAAWSWKNGVDKTDRLFEFAAHSDAIFDLDISPDDSFLVTGAADIHAKIFSLPHGDLIHLLPNRTRGLRVCRFSPVPAADKRLLVATGGDDGQVLLWQVNPLVHGAKRGFTDLKPVVLASAGGTWVTDLCWTQDGRALAVASNTVRLCRPEAESDKLCVFHVRGSVARLVRLTPTGRRLVTIDSAGTLYLLEKVA